MKGENWEKVKSRKGKIWKNKINWGIRDIEKKGNLEKEKQRKKKVGKWENGIKSD